MSSSGADTQNAFREFLEASLTLIDADVRDRYDAMLSRLNARAVVVDVDGERLALIPTARALEIGTASAEQLPILRTTGGVIVALLDGDLELGTALRENRLRLRGASSDLIAFHSALMAYLEGCVRASGMDRLLSRYRGAVDARTKT